MRVTLAPPDLSASASARVRHDFDLTRGYPFSIVIDRSVQVADFMRHLFFG